MNWNMPELFTRCCDAAEFTEIPEISNITETIGVGSITHKLEMEVPERFCSADISSEGDSAPALRHTMSSGALAETVYAQLSHIYLVLTLASIGW